MAIFSPLRSRRFAERQTEANEQMLTFRLCQEWFALPIDGVQKVVLLGKVYGDPNNTGISLTLYQERELLVIDVGHRIFGRSPSENLTGEQTRYLLIVQNAKGDLVGLPVDSPPAIRRVPKSAFKTLPETYLAQGNIQCISSQTIELDDGTTFFLLDRDRLTAQSL
jgi:purine-binding chemotaxis protein CheW